MEDNAQNLQILKAIENQALKAKHARENSVCKTRVSKALYEANKALTSEETTTQKAEIADLENDIKYVEADLTEIQVILEKRTDKPKI